MRVTNNYVMNKFSRSISVSTKNLATLNEQVSSGNKISKASQDTTLAMKAMKVRRDLSRIDQYMTNLSDAQGWFDESESLVTDIKALADEAKLGLLQGMNGTYGEVDRKALAESLNNIKDQILSLGNTSYSGKQILGGPNTKDTPFTNVSGKMYYNGVDMETMTATDGEDIFMDLGMGLTMDGSGNVLPQSALSISLSGQAIMGVGVDSTTGYSNNLYNLLGQLADKFSANDTSDMDAGLSKLTELCDQLTVQMVTVGEKCEYVSFLSTRYEKDQFNALTKQSSIESVDLTQAIVNAKSAEVAYTATLQMGAKIIQPSLMDYLD